MKNIAVFIALTLFISACENTAPTTQPIIFTVVPPTESPAPTPSSTETPAPRLVATVNDVPITVEQFDIELARYLSGISNAPDPNSEQGKQLAASLKDQVIDELVQRALMSQEAARQGLTVSDQQIDEELAITKEKAGGEQKYTSWLTSHKLTESDLRELIRQELLANILRDKVLADIPREVEFVRAFHILLKTEQEARQVLARLQGGAKISTLASLSIDNSTRPDDGDLGWFARETGSIVWQEVEDAAFALQPGETSDVVKSPVGFHIIRVVAREMRPLAETDLTAIQRITLERWMANLKAQTKIVK
jgi:parvulin-like peptidyl-prolyl isomerase